MNFEYATYVVSTIFTTTMHYDLNVAEIYKLHSIPHTKKIYIFSSQMNNTGGSIPLKNT